MELSPHGDPYKTKQDKSLYYINHTKAKAFLLEVCFCDDMDDVVWYKKTGPEEIGRSIAEALIGI